jgi:hypothetical protein
MVSPGETLVELRERCAWGLQAYATAAVTASDAQQASSRAREERRKVPV